MEIERQWCFWRWFLAMVFGEASDDVMKNSPTYGPKGNGKLSPSNGGWLLYSKQQTPAELPGPLPQLVALFWAVRIIQRDSRKVVGGGITSDTPSQVMTALFPKGGAQQSRIPAHPSAIHGTGSGGVTKGLGKVGIILVLARGREGRLWWVCWFLFWGGGRWTHTRN